MVSDIVYAVYGIGLLAFSGIYWVNMIGHNMWYTLDAAGVKQPSNNRVIIMVLTIGGILCLAFAKSLHNQRKILEAIEMQGPFRKL